MKILINSFAIVLPLLLLVVIGYLLKIKKVLSESSVKEFSFVVSNVILPVNIFMNVYGSDFGKDFDLKTVLFIIGMYFLLMIWVVFMTNLFFKDNKQKSALLQVSLRNNSAIFGIPLAISIFGPGVSGAAAFAAALTTPILNIYAVAELEHYTAKENNIKKIILNVFKNPLVLATLVGLVFKLLGIRLPGFADTTCSYISRSTTGISLIVLGASFDPDISGHLKPVIYGVMMKLVINPIIVLSAAVLLGFRDASLVVILAMFASPPAVSCFATACKYDTDVNLTSNVIIYAQIFCLFTLTIIITILRLNGFIA
jgi:predicted permease